MAKKDQLTLAVLNESLKSGNIKMNPAVAAQIQAAMQDNAPAPAAQSNMVELTNAIKENTIAVTKGKSKSTQALDLTETQVEDEKVKKHEVDLLEKIEENTRPENKVIKPTAPEDKGGLDITKIGLFGTLIAGALGAIAGVLIGQAKVMVGALKLLYKMVPTKLVETVVNAVKQIPQLLNDIVTKLLINVKYAFNIVTDLFKNRFPKAFKAIEDTVIGFKNFFVNVFERAKAIVSTLAEAVVKTFNFLKDGFIKYFAKPISEGFNLIRQGSTSVSSGVGKIGGFINGVKDFFSGIGKWLGGFSKVFKGAMVIAEKIAIPITIIMGLFDGITEAIKGYEKGGILGGIQGFITGVLNSVIGGFLDLIKDMISWVLDKLGFDEASKLLDSFSFSGMIKKFIDMLFHPFDTIKNAFESITKWMASIEIPSFSIFGKQFGPWKPLSGLMGQTETTEEGAKANQTSIKQSSSAESHIEQTPDGKIKYFINGKEVDQTAYMDNYNKNNAEMDADIVKPPSTANKIYNQSAEVKASEQAPKAAPKTNNVVTTQQVNNQTNNAIFKNPVRNNDNTYTNYLNSRFAV